MVSVIPNAGGMLSTIKIVSLKVESGLISDNARSYASKSTSMEPLLIESPGSITCQVKVEPAAAVDIGDCPAKESSVESP